MVDVEEVALLAPMAIGGDEGALRAVALPDAPFHVGGDVPGRARRVGPARAGPASFGAGAPGVVGPVLPVEGSNSSLSGFPDVAGAYTAWNADPCDPGLAYGVVDQIGALV